jgi:hypothetical protein
MSDKESSGYQLRRSKSTEELQLESAITNANLDVGMKL